MWEYIAAAFIIVFISMMLYFNLVSNFDSVKRIEKEEEEIEPPNDNITSTIDLVKEIDKNPKNMYGNSVFHRNMYYRDKSDLQKYLQINGLNYISKDIYIRNTPINDMYKKDKRGRFFIIQPLKTEKNKQDN